MCGNGLVFFLKKGETSLKLSCFALFSILLTSTFVMPGFRMFRQWGSDNFILIVNVFTQAAVRTSLPWFVCLI